MNEPVDLNVFRPEFLLEQENARAQRSALRDKLWEEREALKRLLETEVPQLSEFVHALEEHGDVERAIETRCLGALEAQGYLKNESHFVSAELLKNAGRVWSLRWIAHGVSGVDRSGESPKSADQWNEVVLHVGIDATKQRIDTEFYSLNEALGDADAAFDDREKFHIVWEVDETKQGLQLVYAGLGTNEPYDLEHEDRKGVPGSGRPRFFIYDADRNLALHYEVAWKDEGEFDWDWSVRPVEKRGAERRIAFVEFPNGSRFCVSDPELAQAGACRTLERARALVAFLFGSSTAEDESNWRPLFHRFQANVNGPIKLALPRTPPDLQELIDRPGHDYVAYFVAATVAGDKGQPLADPVKTAKRLEPSRRQEYEALFERPCSEVFVSDVAAELPATMRGLFSVEVSRLGPRAIVAVEQWTAQIASEVRRDLYYYGQSPIERFNRLRLGAHLAFSEKHGGVYWKVIEQARALLGGAQPHGRFAVSLSPVEPTRDDSARPSAIIPPSKDDVA